MKQKLSPSVKPQKGEYDPRGLLGNSLGREMICQNGKVLGLCQPLSRAAGGRTS